MNGAVALRSVQVIRDLYVSGNQALWPRPAHTQVLVSLAHSPDVVDRDILKYIVRCRRKRYHPLAAENPSEYMTLGEIQPSRARSGGPFVLCAVSALCRWMNLSREVGEHISGYAILDPSRRFLHKDAIQRGWVWWLLKFSKVPGQSMVMLAEAGHVHAANVMHDRLCNERRPSCSKRLMYLTIEQGNLELVKRHLLNCHEHSVDEWLYVATWIGQVDMVDWMCVNWMEINNSKPHKAKCSVISSRKQLLHSLDATFDEVGSRFVADLMEVETSMNDLDKAARDGNVWYLRRFCREDNITNNLADLAAVYGHVKVVSHVLSEYSKPCSISGLYGAIIRGHYGVAQHIYQNQPELVNWPKIVEGSLILEALLAVDSNELRQNLLGSKNPQGKEAHLHWLLSFLRHERNMRLDTRSLNDAALRGDSSRVKLICQFDLVERLADAADIAATRGDLQTLKVLFDHNSTREKCTPRALDGAAEEGHLEVVQFLQRHKAPCTQRALDLAARNGHVQVVQYILRHRLEGCSPYALYWASALGHVDVVCCLLMYDGLWDLDQCLRAARQQGFDEIVLIIEAHRARHIKAHELRTSSHQFARRKYHCQNSLDAFPSQSHLVITELRQRVELSLERG